MTIIMHRTTRRASEGTLSARQINRAPLTRDPYLLNTQPRKAPPPLRLIRLAEPGPACGFGSCSVTPECTSACRYRQADEALRGHYGRLHTQRQDMPPVPPISAEDRRVRALAWRGVIAVAVATACGIGWTVWAALA